MNRYAAACHHRNLPERPLYRRGRIEAEIRRNYRS
nr:MAG TPA: hypothetical protein [Caudoviricetes sp.]